MPLGPSEADIEACKQAGRDAAVGAIEPKPYGQTSEKVYPYTYWFLADHNEAFE